MEGEKRLCRSREAIIAGVCAGIAEHFDTDALTARILAVVCAFVSAGVAIIAYLILWLLLPKEPETYAPLDVEPQDTHSDRFGEVDYSNHVATPAAMAGWRYTQQSSGTSTKTYTNEAFSSSDPSTAVFSVDATSTVPAASAGSVPNTAGSATNHPGSARRSNGMTVCSAPSQARVQAALLIGSIALFFVLAVVVSSAMQDVVWWQLWPLLLVILGIVRMVVPDYTGWHLDGFTWGFVLFFLGATILPVSIGVISLISLWFMVIRLWPLLGFAIVLFVVGSLAKKPVMRLISALLFAAFCIVGVLLCAQAGTIDPLVVTTPYGREYQLAFFA